MKLDDLANVRPERAQYLAQGERHANRQGRAALGIMSL